MGAELLSSQQGQPGGRVVHVHLLTLHLLILHLLALHLLILHLLTEDDICQ